MEDLHPSTLDQCRIEGARRLHRGLGIVDADEVPLRHTLCHARECIAAAAADVEYRIR